MRLEKQITSPPQQEKTHQSGNTSKKPASFKGKPITDFDTYLASLPQIKDNAAFNAFECAIAEERGIRRRLAEEKAG